MSEEGKRGTLVMDYEERRKERTKKWREGFAENPEEAFRELMHRMDAMSRRINELESQFKLHVHMQPNGELAYRDGRLGRLMKEDFRENLGKNPLPPM